MITPPPLFVEGHQDEYLAYQLANVRGIPKGSFKAHYDREQGGWQSVGDSLEMAVRQRLVERVGGMLDADGRRVGLVNGAFFSRLAGEDRRTARRAVG